MKSFSKKNRIWIPHIVFNNEVKRMKRNALIILILLLICSDILAQSGSSIYHLKGATFQGTNFNPSFMPHEKFVLGLPIISGVNIGLNAPFTYDEVMKSDENALAEKFNGEDHFSAQADITLLYLGWKPIDRLGISLFARQRFQTRAYIDESLAQAAADGMKDLNSANIQSNDTKIDARYYREYGIGLATSSKDRKIDFGIRVKLIYGISNISSSDNMALSVEVNDLDKIENMIQNTEGQLNMDDLKQSVQISNAYVNTSGENTVQDFSSHINPTQNIGMGLDLGINWRLDQNVSVAFAVNDIGFINWKKDIKNYEVDNLNLNISSADDLMLSDGTIDATLIDSLQNVLEADTTHSAYKTGLNANAFGSISYDITSRDQATE